MKIMKTDELVEYLRYKRSLTKQLDKITDEQYMENPIGFEIYGYIDKLIEQYTEKEMDWIFDNQNALMTMYL